MGIKDLWPQVKEAKKECSLGELKDKFAVKRIAVDANIVIGQFYRGAWTQLAQRGHPSTDECYRTTMARIQVFANDFRRLDIDLVWCFDGIKSVRKLATAERLAEHAQRVAKLLTLWNQLKAKAKAHEEKETVTSYEPIMKIHIEKMPSNIEVSNSTTTDSFGKIFDDFCSRLQWCPVFPLDMNDNILNEMKVKGCLCIRVPEISEAEKLASILNHIDFAQAVYGDDSDYIALRTPLVIKDIVKQTAEIYKFSDIAKILDVSEDRVFVMCVILGNDFNKRVRLHGPVKAKKLAQDPSFSLEAFETQYGSETVQLANCKAFLSISARDIELVKAHL